jgi:hypothetical protein
MGPDGVGREPADAVGGESADGVRVGRTARVSVELAREVGSESSDDGGWTGRAMSALKILNDVRARGGRRTSETSFRSRLARRSEGIPPVETVDLLVRKGVVERDERLDPQGNPSASYLILTGAGERVLDQVCGGIERAPLRWLSSRLRALKAGSRRDDIACFLEKQLAMADSGGPVSMAISEDESMEFISRAASPAYVEVLEFFGYLGSLQAGETVDFKEISGALNKGRRDSVKMLEGLRTTISKVAEWEIGASLESMGVRGARLLYWIPFSGDLRPDGHRIWGVAPSISTKDVTAAQVFLSEARVIALVENRAALEHLIDCGLAQRGWLGICTEGMPKHGLFEMLSKIEGMPQSDRLWVIWTDWDLGGLRITEQILVRLRRLASSLKVVVVPHPGVSGRRIDLPPGFGTHTEPVIREIATAISIHGAVYQEEVFSLFGAVELEEIAEIAQSRPPADSALGKPTFG